jgi:hypothetical protein
MLPHYIFDLYYFKKFQTKGSFCEPVYLLKLLYLVHRARFIFWRIVHDLSRL